MFLTTFLQIPTDPALNQAVDQLTKSSIEIAQAASDYGALKVIFGVFMVFMILLVILFVYQVFSMNSKIGVINQAAVKTQQYFEGVMNRTLGKEQANVILRRSLNNISIMIKYHVLRIRLENHISDKEGTEKKINQIIHNEYIELHTFLSNFLVEEQPLSDILNQDDCLLIKQFVIEQVYTSADSFKVSQMDQSADILMNGIKLECIKRLKDE